MSVQASPIKSNLHFSPGEPLRLWLVRHGLTEWNQTGRWQGWSNPGLAEEGRQQALRVRPRLEGKHFDLVCSSDLLRAVQTAQLAGFEPTLDSRLREVNFGLFEGRTNPENATHPDFAAWLNDPFGQPTPAGEGYADLQARVLGWLEDLPASGDVLAFVHGGVIQALCTHVLGLEPFAAPRLWKLRVTHGSISVLERWPIPTGVAWTLERINDTAHLEQLASSGSVRLEG